MKNGDEINRCTNTTTHDHEATTASASLIELFAPPPVLPVLPNVNVIVNVATTQPRLDEPSPAHQAAAAAEENGSLPAATEAAQGGFAAAPPSTMALTASSNNSHSLIHLFSPPPLPPSPLPLAQPRPQVVQDRSSSIATVMAGNRHMSININDDDDDDDDNDDNEITERVHHHPHYYTADDGEDDDNNNDNGSDNGWNEESHQMDEDLNFILPMDDGDHQGPSPVMTHQHRVEDALSSSPWRSNTISSRHQRQTVPPPLTPANTVVGMEQWLRGADSNNYSNNENNNTNYSNHHDLESTPLLPHNQSPTAADSNDLSSWTAMLPSSLWTASTSSSSSLLQFGTTPKSSWNLRKSPPPATEHDEQETETTTITATPMIKATSIGVRSSTLPPIREMPVVSMSGASSIGGESVYSGHIHCIGSSNSNNKRCDWIGKCTSSSSSSCFSVGQYLSRELTHPNTWMGSFMYLLYHLVFNMTVAAAVYRPHATNPTAMLGLWSKLSIQGVLFGSPNFWIALQHDIPAMYPTADLFTAPFLAQLAAIVDQALYDDDNSGDASRTEAEKDLLFVTTFSCLVAMSMMLSATLIVLASAFKLANLGSYLPYPVLAGFFASVGVVTWTLAFQVDSGGPTLFVLLRGSNLDPTLTDYNSMYYSQLYHALAHHTPTLLVATVMKILGPQHPLYVVGSVLVTFVLFYVVMAATGLSRAHMIEQGWFWNPNDLVVLPLSSLSSNVNNNNNESNSFFATLGSSWLPPAPMAWIHGLYAGQLHRAAFQKGMATAVALAFLYWIRCSLHGSALRKNVQNLTRTERRRKKQHQQTTSQNTARSSFIAPQRPALSSSLRSLTTSSSNVVIGGQHPEQHRRKFSEVIDIEQLPISTPIRTQRRPLKHGNKEKKNPEDGDDDDDDSKNDNDLACNRNRDEDHENEEGQDDDDDDERIVVIKADPPTVSIKEILVQYGISQYLSALAGGFAVVPSIAASSTMYLLGAENVAPQVGSGILVSIFYFTDFRLVSYIPKTAFSSLLVLSCFDLMGTWFFKSYFRTQEKMEWLVVPLIVVLASVMSMLDAVFLGLAMSTFLFVASFFRSGIVKYIANGITLRSTIERPIAWAKFLDQHGEYIQILVLQNYLFFGNASSMESYIRSMFDKPPDDVDMLLIPPMPKIIILDLTLVTGMDTSAVDVFADILVIAKNHQCKVFLSGLGSDLRKVMFLGGIKPELTKVRSQRHLRFFSDLDAAIGKAEDMLLQEGTFEQEMMSNPRAYNQGFQGALEYLDEQHDTKFFPDLVALQEFTTVVDVDDGDILYEQSGLSDRGLFFIESGVLKIELNSDFTMSRVGGNSFLRSGGTLNSIKARSSTVGEAIARLKAGGTIDAMTKASKFRVARVGPGWVLGSIEALCGVQYPVKTVAVSQCRLHYIPYWKLEELEQSNPVLILNLYKLLSYLMAKRHELTIGQLGTLHSIMSSPAQKRPMGRVNSFNTVTK